MSAEVDAGVAVDATDTNQSRKSTKSVRFAGGEGNGNVGATTSSSSTLRRRTGSVTTTIFTKLLYDTDPVDPEKNGGVWVVGHLLLDHSPSLQQVRDTVLERAVKKFVRMRSVLKLNDKGESCFEEIPIESLDWDYHVPDLSAATRNWTKDDVYKFIGGLNEFKYDITKPLFRYLLIPQMEDGKASIVACVNHAIGDGLALVAVTESLYDTLPEEDQQKAKHQGKKAVVAGQRMDLATKAGIFLYGVYHGLSIPLARPDPPNPLRLPAGQRAMGKKVLALTDPIPLDKVKEIKNKMEGTTINDIVMGLMTMTLKRFFIEEGRYRPGEKVTAQFPISMRAIGEGGLDASGEPHNKISYAYFDFNFEGDREHIIWQTKHQIDCIKLSPSPFVVSSTAQLANKLLPRKAMLDLVRDAGDLGSAQLSNVPASQSKVSVFGIEILDMSFFLFSPLSCYLGILTYNGVLNAAFNLDSGLNVDPKRLAKHWNNEFEELYRDIMSREGVVKEPKHDDTFYRNVTKGFLFFVELLVLAIAFSAIRFLTLLVIFASFVLLLIL